MGRHKKYTTEEQRLAADRADKRRWYQKTPMVSKGQRGEEAGVPFTFTQELLQQQTQNINGGYTRRAK